MIRAPRAKRLSARASELLDSLWLVPGLLILGFVGLAALLIWVDSSVDLSAADWIFSGDASAARGLLATIAGSLITIAGLTFSITIVALQLASSQFSPRVLRTFMGDRITQITAGAFIGTFAYCLLVMRSVQGRDAGEEPFIPSLSVTVAIALAILALVLLLVFVHHIAQLIQVSRTAAVIARQSLDRLDVLYPEPFGAPVEAQAEATLARWVSEREPVTIFPAAPGFVQRVIVEDLVRLPECARARVAIDVAPGDFATLDRPLVRIWLEGDSEPSADRVRKAIVVEEERNIAQDLAFGVRQLTDIALRALSPSLNDPTTASTCIGYIRSILVQLAARGFPTAVREFEDEMVTAVVRVVPFSAFLESFAEIARHANGNTRVSAEIADGLEAIARSAESSGARDRSQEARALARLVDTELRTHATKV